MPDQSPSVWSAWYEVTESKELRQGDLFRDLLVVRLPQDLPPDLDQADPQEPPRVRVRLSRTDYIVISPSCDIVRGPDTHVLLARVGAATAANFGSKSESEFRSKLEVLRQGYDPGNFLLPESLAEGASMPMSFVRFKDQAFLPLQYMLAQCTGPRLRLRPPFREKLGFWAAANLGRVGIEDEVQIPRQSSFSPSKVLQSVDE